MCLDNDHVLDEFFIFIKLVSIFPKLKNDDNFDIIIKLKNSKLKKFDILNRLIIH